VLVSAYDTGNDFEDQSRMGTLCCGCDSTDHLQLCVSASMSQSVLRINLPRYVNCGTLLIVPPAMEKDGLVTVLTGFLD